MLIIGEKEAESGTVSVRKQGHGDQGSFSVDDFLTQLNSEIQAAF